MDLLHYFTGYDPHFTFFNSASVWKMVASKRAAADPTRSSNENKRTCSGEGGTTESLVSGVLVLRTYTHADSAIVW